MISNKITNGIVGNINIPSDKSISHRSIIIPSISMGISEIDNLLMSDDVLHTLNAFKTLGVKIEKSNDKVIIYGKGLNSLKKPKKISILVILEPVQGFSQVFWLHRHLILFWKVIIHYHLGQWQELLTH